MNIGLTMYSQIRDKYATLAFPFKLPDANLRDCFGFTTSSPSPPGNASRTTTASIPFRVDTPNPAVDYAHPIDDFLEIVSLEPTKYEYKKLKERDQRKNVLKINADVAKRRNNLHWNRFINIYPYDFNRIKLQVPIANNDYLNGSYITGDKSMKDSKNSPTLVGGETMAGRGRAIDYSKYENVNFLATQGPLSETVDHHWQAIYENNVDMIVMLTKLVEGDGNTKCEQYWPSNVGETSRFGSYDVMLVSEENPRPTEVRRQLYLLDTRESCNKRKTGGEKSIIHLHYVGWPDYGVPEENDHIVNLVKDVREIIKGDTTRKQNYNILVHCSAGVGRTGTFIALYKLMEEIEAIMERRLELSSNTLNNDNQKINIFSTVFSLREKRVEMVQSWAQYKYLYASVSTYASQLNGTYVETDDTYVNYNH